MCMPKHLYTQSYTHNTVNKDQMLDRDPVVWSDLQVSTLCGSSAFRIASFTVHTRICGCHSSKHNWTPGVNRCKLCLLLLLLTWYVAQVIHHNQRLSRDLFVHHHRHDIVHRERITVFNGWQTLCRKLKKKKLINNLTFIFLKLKSAFTHICSKVLIWNSK